MGYELHIEHPNNPFLDFDRWGAAVRSTPGVRPTPAEKGPGEKTGEWDGIAEMALEKSWVPPFKKWAPVFFWSSGSVSFELGDRENEVLKAALALAAKVDAEIRGDEGELYSSVDDLNRVFLDDDDDDDLLSDDGDGDLDEDD